MVLRMMERCWKRERERERERDWAEPTLGLPYTSHTAKVKHNERRKERIILLI